MITDLWIENFKGIGKRQHIPLRPITLLFGANSAGKSTVLHALMYLRECLCSNNPDPRKPLEGDHSVNLGGFANILHDSKKNGLSIAVTVDGGDADYSEAYYLTKNQHERAYPENEPQRFDGPLRIDNHRSGFSSTGLSYNGWEPKCTIELTVQNRQMSRMTFAFNGCPSVSIWRAPGKLNNERSQGPLEPAQEAFPRILAWINPWCGALYPENYEAMGLNLTLDDSHALITEKGAEKRIEFFKSLNDCFESLYSTFEANSVEVSTNWLVSFAILDIPTQPQSLTSVGFFSTGVLVPLDSVIESVAVCTGADLTLHTIDSSGLYVWLFRTENGSYSEHVSPLALVSSSISKTPIDDAIGMFRFVCTNDPLCQPITLARCREVVPDFAQPLDIEVPLIADGSEAGLCYLSERQAIIDELIRGSLSSLKYSLESLTYVGPKRSTVPRNLNSDVMDEFSSWGDGLGAWRWMLQCNENSLTRCSTLLGDLETGLGTGFTLEREEVYEFPKEVFRLYRDGHTLDAILEHFSESEEDHVFSDWNSARSFQKIILRENRSGKRRHPQDVGEGITQVIPVVAAFVRASGKAGLIAVEQPELHLHPSLAAKLGDLAITTILSDCSTRGSRALIETHSEHLILRILRRIRQTTNAELPPSGHIPPVKPDDVCVLWVDNLGEGTVISRLRISETGRWLDRWPDGFFRERHAELFE